MTFQDLAQKKGVHVQVFGLSEDNARAFWNWEFIGPQSDLSQTRDVLVRACDVRLSNRLSEEELGFIGTALVDAAEEVRASCSRPNRQSSKSSAKSTLSRSAPPLPKPSRPARNILSAK